MANESKREQPPRAVRLIRAELNKLLQQPDPSRPGKAIGTAKTGVYAFFDYDLEPIYVGQTSSSFSDRISRHLTGQRSDAVAKFILDPFEVAFVSMWSIPDIATAKVPPGWPKAAAAYRRQLLEPYEFTVYKQLEAGSQFDAVLNEGVIKETALAELPEPVHGRIIPAELWEDRKHPDVRIARRASTISRLSQMVSEREVSAGMRRTLLLQARRLEWLTERRVRELRIERPGPGEMLDDLFDEDS
ncbi:MAG: GIY-YIG nuclease family protein [Ktedonobacterales bacterium]